MGDKHAKKGASLRKQNHAKQDLQQSKADAAKKQALDAVEEIQPILKKTNERLKGKKS